MIILLLCNPIKQNSTMNFLIPLEANIPSTLPGNLGIISLLAVPILILIAIILAIVKQKKAAKKALIGAGICALVGVGFCGWYWSH